MPAGKARVETPLFWEVYNLMFFDANKPLEPWECEIWQTNSTKYVLRSAPPTRTIYNLPRNN